MDATWYEILIWLMIPTVIGVLASEIDVLGHIKDHFHRKPAPPMQYQRVRSNTMK